MYPYINIFGLQISTLTIGIIISFSTFLITARVLTKKNHQDFLKLFYRIPGWVILSYILGRYVAFSLETGIYIPSSTSQIVSILSHQNFNFHFVGILISSWICLSIFFSSIKRNENKKIWADILFISTANAIIILGIFLTLGDTVIGKPTDGIFAIRALSDNSNLTKFDGVYPVGLFLSFGTLAVHVIVSVLSIIFKKNGIGMWGFIGLLIVFNIVFLFQAYPRHGLITFLGMSFDIKQYTSFFVMIWCCIVSIKRGRKRF